jgi:phosphatidylglycerol lysyltransferase
MKPPHHQAIVKRLQTISQEWLEQPGRTERGLMMGYFSSEYLEQCEIMVVRDGAGTIQAFLNQIPSFNLEEANFDMLRQASGNPGNINDFLLLNFIDYLDQKDFKRLNLGLCPLAGLDKKETDYSLIDNALRFAYANGDRLYSFSGLHRFKSKYEPEWSDRYIVFRSGIRGFTRTLNALNRAMKVAKRLTK